MELRNYVSGNSHRVAAIVVAPLIILVNHMRLRLVQYIMNNGTLMRSRVAAIVLCAIFVIGFKLRRVIISKLNCMQIELRDRIKSVGSGHKHFQLVVPAFYVKDEDHKNAQNVIAVLGYASRLRFRLITDLHNMFRFATEFLVFAGGTILSASVFQTDRFATSAIIRLFGVTGRLSFGNWRIGVAELSVLSLRPSGPLRILGSWMEETIPAVKQQPRVVNGTMPKYITSTNEGKVMNYSQAHYLGKRLVGELRSSLKKNEGMSIFEWYARYPEFIADIKDNKYGSGVRKEFHEFNKLLRQTAKLGNVDVPPYIVAVVDNEPAATASNATNAFSLTQRGLDKRGEVMIMPGPRELSERTSVVTPKGTIISDKGDSGLIYTNQNGGIKRQIESFAAGSEPKEKLDSLQAKVIHTTVVEHIRKNTNSFNSPGTRMAMTLRDENMIRHQGLVDALNRPIHRETDIFSLEWAQTQPINGYEKFVTQPTNFAIIGGGNAAIHKAVENHLTKSSESSKLLNEVSEYAPRVHKVRIHDDNAKPSA